MYVYVCALYACVMYARHSAACINPSSGPVGSTDENNRPRTKYYHCPVLSGSVTVLLTVTTKHRDTSIIAADSLKRQNTNTTQATALCALAAVLICQTLTGYWS